MEELEAREGISLDITATSTRGVNAAQWDSTRLMTTWVQFQAGVAGRFFFLQSQGPVLTLISASAPPLCYRSSTPKSYLVFFAQRYV